jgi:hypothetical protein
MYTPYRQIYENLFFWLGTGTLKSDGVNIVVWAKNSLEHIWYLIITYMCLCFTFVVYLVQ